MVFSIDRSSLSMVVVGLTMTTPEFFLYIFLPMCAMFTMGFCLYYSKD
jgi:hypothetical protein